MERHFGKDLPASQSACPSDFRLLCHSQVLAAVLKSLMRTPGPVSHDVSCRGLCVCVVYLLLGIKWSPTCGKLPFRGPFKSDFMQSPFPHGTGERWSAVVTQLFMLAAWLPREIIPPEMSFNTSCQQTTWSRFPSVCQIMTITTLELRCALSKGARF